LLKKKNSDAKEKSAELAEKLNQRELEDKQARLDELTRKIKELESK
jgi:hypothetical protein